MLGLLQGKYRGAVAQEGKGDRFEAVLVKDSGAKFIPVAAGGHYALGASFQPGSGTHEILLLSAHADAFNAAQRWIYTEALIDWAHSRAQSSEVFIAGDRVAIIHEGLLLYEGRPETAATLTTMYRVRVDPVTFF